MDDAQKFEAWKMKRQQAGLCYTYLDVHFNNCIMRATCNKPFGHEGACRDDLTKGNFVKPGTIDHVPDYPFKQKFNIINRSKEEYKKAIDAQEKMSLERAKEHFKRRNKMPSINIPKWVWRYVILGTLLYLFKREIWYLLHHFLK